MNLKSKITSFAIGSLLAAGMTGVTTESASAATSNCNRAVTPQSWSYARGTHCGVTGPGGADWYSMQTCSNWQWTKLQMVRRHHARNVYFSGCHVVPYAPYRNATTVFSFRYTI